MSNDPRIQDSTLCDLVAQFDIFEQPRRLKPIRSLVADTNDGSTATGMKQYHVQNFGIVNGINSIYGLGTKSDASGYKIFKKTDIAGPSWSALSGAFAESTDTLWPGIFQPSVGSDQFLYFLAGDKFKALNYNGGAEYVNPSVDFPDVTTSVAEGVVAKDQNAYFGRNNSIYRVTAPGAPQTFTVTIASPGVFTSTAHGLISGSRVRFTTTGALPTGIVAGTEYFVIATGLTADAFEVSATLGGSAINTSVSQSGTHTLYRPPSLALQLSIPATHEVSSIDTNGNYLAFSACPKASTVNVATMSPGTVAANGAPMGWQNPNNAKVSDDAYTTLGPTTGVGSVEYLTVAGGGSGGNSFSNSSQAGGGGAGGLLQGVSLPLTAGAHAITVGAGGAGGVGGNGGNSSIDALIVAIGGGGGANVGTGQTGIGASGGSGGGAAGNAVTPGTGGGAATSGQGNVGGNRGITSAFGAAGGGGSGGAGSSSSSGAASGSAGGAGLASSISGASLTYAAGGGGSTLIGHDGAAGTANTGNGGVGSTQNGSDGQNGGAGGSGVVVVRYHTDGSDGISNTSTGGTITTSGGYTIHTFTASGTFTVVAAALTNPFNLKATNFGMTIPSGATINGIKIDIEKKASGVVTDNIVKIIKADGSFGTLNKALADAWGSSDGYISYGGSLDLWGESWAYTDINDADFGVVISATVPDSGTASIDHIRITVYYTAAPPSYPNLESYLYIWDLVSPDVTEAIKMGPGKLSVIENVGGVILGVTDEYLSDSFGNDKGKIVIRGWSGGEAQILKTIPALASGGSLSRFKGIKGGHIYFYAKIPTDVNASTYREGIWAFGRKDTQSPWALSLEYDTSQFASSVQGFRFIGNFLMIGHSTDGSISRSADTETYAYTSIYQSQIYENEFENQLTSVELTIEPLPSGAVATVKVRQNAETAWTTLFSMTTANATFDLRSKLASGEDFAKFHTCQFRVESTGGAVPLKFRAKYITLIDESDE